MHVCVCVQVFLHGEVVDKGLFGDLHIEADTLCVGARVHHWASNSGVSKPRRDPALNLIALKCDIISTNSLQVFETHKYINRSNNETG